MNLIEKKIREKLFNRLNEIAGTSKTGWRLEILPDSNLRVHSANNYATANLADRAMVVKFKNVPIKSSVSPKRSAVGIGVAAMDPKKTYRHLDFKLTDPAFITDLNTIISKSNLITAQDMYKSGDYLFVWTCTKNTKYRKTFVVWFVYTKQIKLTIQQATKLKLIDSSKDTTTVNMMQQFIANKIQLIDVDTAIDWSDTLKSKIKTDEDLLAELERNMPKFHKMKQAKVDDDEDEAEDAARLAKKSSKINTKLNIINSQNNYWLKTDYIDPEGYETETDASFSTYDLVKKQKTEVFRSNESKEKKLEFDKIKSNLLLIAPIEVDDIEIPKNSMWTKTEKYVIYKHDDLVTWDQIPPWINAANKKVPGKWGLPDTTIFDSLLAISGSNKILNLNTNTITAEPFIKTNKIISVNPAQASLLGAEYSPVVYPIGNDVKISSITPWAFSGIGDVKTTIDLKKQIITMKQGSIVFKPPSKNQISIVYLFTGKFKNNSPDWNDPASKLNFEYPVGGGVKKSNPIKLLEYDGSFEIDNFKLLTGVFNLYTNNNTGNIILKEAIAANYIFTPDLGKINWTYTGTYYSQHDNYLAFKDGKISTNDKRLKSEFIQITAGKFVKPAETTDEVFNNDLQLLGLSSVVVNTKEIVKINPPWMFAGGAGTPWPSNIKAPIKFTPLKFEDNEFIFVYTAPITTPEYWVKHWPNYYGSAVDKNNKEIAIDAAPVTEFYIKTSTFTKEPFAGIQQYIKFTRDTTNINEFNIF